jgi:hypothetical protein
MMKGARGRSKQDRTLRPGRGLIDLSDLRFTMCAAAGPALLYNRQEPDHALRKIFQLNKCLLKNVFFNLLN